MPLPKLALDIDQSQYSVTPGNEVEETRVESGPAWRRKDFIGAPHQVSLRLIMEQFAYQYFMAFYRTTLVRGLYPFLIDLKIDGPDMREYQATFMANSLSITQNGDVFMAAATLEVKRSAVEAVDDVAVLALFDAYGENAATALNRLAQLANVDLEVLS